VYNGVKFIKANLMTFIDSSGQVSGELNIKNSKLMNELSGLGYSKIQRSIFARLLHVIPASFHPDSQIQQILAMLGRYEADRNLFMDLSDSQTEGFYRMLTTGFTSFGLIHGMFANIEFLPNLSGIKFNGQNLAGPQNGNLNTLTIDRPAFEFANRFVTSSSSGLSNRSKIYGYPKVYPVPVLNLNVCMNGTLLTPISLQPFWVSRHVITPDNITKVEKCVASGDLNRHLSFLESLSVANN
jgi:hypothetical protein